MNKKCLMILIVFIAVVAVLGTSTMIEAAHPGNAYVFTNDGINSINLNNGKVRTEGDHWKQMCSGEGLDEVCESIPKAGWPDNVYNEARRVIWGNFRSGVFSLDTKTMKFNKIITGSTSGNWAVQTPDGKEVYVAARKPRQAYLLIDGDPDSATYATELASIPIPFIPSRLKPGQLGPGPCDAAMTVNGLHIWEPDIWHDTLTRIDTVAAGGLAIGHQYFITELASGVRVEPFMSTVDLSTNGQYVLVENLEGRPRGTESVFDISNPNAPIEVVRFVQSDRPEVGGTFIGGAGETVSVRGGLGSGPRSDEFTRDNLYSLIIQRNSDDVAVVNMSTLTIDCSVALPAGSKASTGDWSVDGKQFLVSLDRLHKVGVIKYDASASTCSTKFTFDSTIDLWGTRPAGIVVKTHNAQ